jgi:hypothetical protein
MSQPKRPDKTPFVLSAMAWREPSASDRLKALYDPHWSDMRSEALGRRLWYWRVENLDKPGHDYTVELFEGVNREPCAACSCIAYVVCKHILEALVWTLDIEPTFGQDFRHTGFMTGLSRLIAGRQHNRSRNA